MEKEINIGTLIENEVRKLGISASKFGELIHCERQNVYKIFRRAHLDTVQLAQISKALNHNFFADIATNISLSGVDDKEACQEVYNRTAIAQFCEVIPRIFHRMKLDTFITIGRPVELSLDTPMPEYTINPYYLTFSTDRLLADNPDCAIKETAEIWKYKDEESGVIIDRWIFKHSGFVLYNMVLDYKTEEEWEQVIKYFLNHVYRTSVL